MAGMTGHGEGKGPMMGHGMGEQGLMGPSGEGHTHGMAENTKTGGDVSVSSPVTEMEPHESESSQ